MTPAVTVSPPLWPPRSAGELRFVSREDEARLRGALETGRFLVVTVPAPKVTSRGRVGELLRAGVEAALSAVHAGPAPLAAAGAAPRASNGVGEDLQQEIAGWVTRAQSAGRSGLGVFVGPLAALADGEGTLDLDDARWLRALAAATAATGQRLVLLLDAENQALRAHGPALGLARVLGDAAAKPEPVVTSSELRDALNRLREVARSAPLPAIEKAFVEGWIPLRQAMLEGRSLSQVAVSAQEVRTKLATFSVQFSKAYSEAFPTFGSTGRHPQLVSELFDVAQRSARVHGARMVHVVVVDALRYDLGLRVRARMQAALAGHAVAVEHHVLWSHLPSTSEVQLDALARGEDALRSPSRLEADTATTRGRSLDVFRRVRVGKRHVIKLDLLEGRLREGGPPERMRLDGLAAEIAGLLLRHVRSLPPRTLVAIVGDHGFTFGELEADDVNKSTPAARQGGASPEEVLVPFDAWLTGVVH